MLFAISSLIGRSESTRGPTGHPTESRELLRPESSLQKELLPDVVTPITAMVAAQCHCQAQHWARTTTCWCWSKTPSWPWLRWFWWSEAFMGWFFFLWLSCSFQQTAQSQIWERNPNMMRLDKYYRNASFQVDVGVLQLKFWEKHKLSSRFCPAR